MTKFVDVLNEMRDHYQNNINTGVAIPYYPNLVEDSLGLMEATNKYLVADVDANELTDNSVQSKLNDLQNQAKDLASNTASSIEEKIKKSAKDLKEKIILLVQIQNLKMNLTRLERVLRNKLLIILIKFLKKQRI